MTFEATSSHKEVSLAEGLNLLQLNKASKLYSDGLEENEYIEFDSRKGFCYEDWYLETDDDYFDDVDDYCEQYERAEELTEFNQALFEQIDWKKIERMTR